jgi:hypothetical protein
VAAVSLVVPFSSGLNMSRPTRNGAGLPRALPPLKGLGLASSGLFELPIAACFGIRHVQGM